LDTEGTPRYLYAIKGRPVLIYSTTYDIIHNTVVPVVHYYHSLMAHGDLARVSAIAGLAARVLSDRQGDDAVALRKSNGRFNHRIPIDLLTL